VSTDVSGTIYWNRSRISKRQFADFLGQISKNGSGEFVVFQPNQSTDCSIVNKFRDQMESVLHCSKGFCGEGPKDKVDEIKPSWLGRN